MEHVKTLNNIARVGLAAASGFDLRFRFPAFCYCYLCFPISNMFSTNVFAFYTKEFHHFWNRLPNHWKRLNYIFIEVFRGRNYTVMCSSLFNDKIFVIAEGCQHLHRYNYLRQVRIRCFDAFIFDVFDIGCAVSELWALALCQQIYKTNKPISICKPI